MRGALKLVARDPLYEARFVREVVRAAEQRFQITAFGYEDRVQRRLAIGADRYGDDDFLHKDVIGELLDETPDLCCYSLLEVQKRLIVADEDDACAFHLFEVSVHGAAADWHARMAKRS